MLAGEFEPQVNEYSCGPTALNYFLAQHNWHFSVPYLIGYLKPTPELGTLPYNIERLLEDYKIPYEVKQFPLSTPINELFLPVLVNYNCDNEGDHYGVITELDKDSNITLWNPYSAELNYFSRQAFQQVWYSPLKKLKNWSLYLT